MARQPPTPKCLICGKKNPCRKHKAEEQWGELARRIRVNRERTARMMRPRSPTTGG